ncbi:hypothetical protein Bhyg_04991 [Pseudolycoriella hygida]|uniref:Uncharacterized protein n=1 Tax=Pseudolycoriella hygida TaxID=35572 RepID=A0A9Q0NGZ6_9DIPT|nr:hypothetical protein Bhyg_04991 [Pseudolycoriella hygida]
MEHKFFLLFLLVPALLCEAGTYNETAKISYIRANKKSQCWTELAFPNGVTQCLYIENCVSSMVDLLTKAVLLDLEVEVEIEGSYETCKPLFGVKLKNKLQ